MTGNSDDTSGEVNTNDVSESTEETTTATDQLDEMAAAMEAESVGGEKTEEETTEETTDATDHMSEMAAAMEAEGVAVEAGSDSGGNEGTDHMADMAAAMAAEGVAIEQEMPSSAEAIARSVSGKDVNIDTLLKVPVSLSIEVGRTQMVLSDLLETQEGTVIELERLLEEPLDILVNGALIAHGVVVLANEKFGLQITDIISLEERARSL